MSPILFPVISLVIWTFIVWIWVYATRLPAIIKARVDFRKVRNGAQLRQVLPENVNWISDNYNHLHEQPVLFYAICIILAISNNSNETNINLAWGYFIFRVLHSLWQSLFNIVRIRFVIFTIGSFILMTLGFRTFLLFF